MIVYFIGLFTVWIVGGLIAEGDEGMMAGVFLVGLFWFLVLPLFILVAFGGAFLELMGWIARKVFNRA